MSGRILGAGGTSGAEFGEGFINSREQGWWAVNGNRQLETREEAELLGRELRRD